MLIANPTAILLTGDARFGALTLYNAWNHAQDNSSLNEDDVDNSLHLIKSSLQSWRTELTKMCKKNSAVELIGNTKGRVNLLESSEQSERGIFTVEEVDELIDIFDNINSRNLSEKSDEVFWRLHQYIDRVSEAYSEHPKVTY